MLFPIRGSAPQSYNERMSQDKNLEISEKLVGTKRRKIAQDGTGPTATSGSGGDMDMPAGFYLPDRGYLFERGPFLQEEDFCLNIEDMLHKSGKDVVDNETLYDLTRQLSDSLNNTSTFSTQNLRQ